LGPGRDVAWAASLEGAVESGYVPPFRAEERVRSWTALAGQVDLDHAVVLGARFDWRWDRTGSGWVSGPGDLRLGTVVYTGRLGIVDTSLGWELKLPNAGDEGEIGTDETDARFGGTLSWEQGPWTARGSLGLAVLGNPLRFANQDDVPLVRAEAAWTGGPFVVGAHVFSDVQTARNPARTRAGALLRYGSRLYLDAGLDVGITPADADISVLLRVGATGARTMDAPGGGV
jgi:hypothetical protein